MYCTSSSSSTLMFTNNLPEIDKLNDTYGVLMNGDPTVVNYYETEEY